MKLIGQTFSEELRAAGIDLNGLSWGDDGVIEYREDVPQATRDAIAAVFAAHNPGADKLPAYIAARKDAEALELQRTKDAFAACLEEIFAFVKNPALHATVGSLKQAVVAKYRAKF